MKAYLMDLHQRVYANLERERHGESGVEGLSQVQAAYMEEMGPST
jgi:hypothetical protein